MRFILENRPDEETRCRLEIIEVKLTRVLKLLTRFRMEERTMDLALEQKFQEMVDEVAAIGTVVDSNDALLDNLAQMLADAIANSANLEEIKTKVGDVKNLIITQKDKLSAAVVAHTPASEPPPPPPVIE